MRTFLTFPRSAAALAPSDPFKEMDRLFSSGLFGRGGASAESDGLLLPRLDVKETEKSLIVSAELPGVDEKDVEVEVSERMLTVRGEKKQEAEKDEKGYHVAERTYGSFTRSLQLPYAVDAGTVEAVFAKGVLTLTIPKPQAVVQSTKKVAIKAA